ncbi:xylose isomerase, partial [Anoxybacillus sp. LAT27]|nr:xylose isomerase [Anoxybacillus sp. LAT27]
VFEQFIEERYKSYTEGIGREIVEGTADFKKLEEYALQLGEIRNTSGRLERLKTLLNQYLLEVSVPSVSRS